MLCKKIVAIIMYLMWLIFLTVMQLACFDVLDVNAWYLYLIAIGSFLFQIILLYLLKRKSGELQRTHRNKAPIGKSEKDGGEVDVAIATGGTAVPIIIAAGGGAASGALNSMYSQHKETGQINLGEVLMDAAIGAVSNVISLGMSCPKERVTTGKLLHRLSANSKNIVEEGAKKVAQHGSRELIRKTTYKGVVTVNLALAFGESALMSASNTFWTEKVVPCLLY